MKKLFIGALAVAGASVIFAWLAPGAYNDVVNWISAGVEWLKTR